MSGHLGDGGLSDAEARSEQNGSAASSQVTPSGGPGLRRFVLGGLLVALLLAGGVSLFASANPDGLDSVTRAGCTFNAQDEVVSGSCLAQKAREHGLAGSPFAGYATEGVGGSASTAISGVVGVLVTLGVAFGVTLVLRRRTAPTRSAVTPSSGR
jgi:cobalt/nickel transport protein